MELSLSNLKTQNFYPKLISTLPKTKQHLAQWAPPKKKMGAMIKCGGNTNLTVELKRELQEIENQGREMNNKCKEDGSTAEEILECLEREAIMGDDEGREPTDYNRRAQIFDKSSKVFQALKEKELRNTTDATQSKI